MTRHRKFIVMVFGILIAVIALQFALPVTVFAAPGESNTLRMYNYYDRGYSFDNSYPEPFAGHSSSFYSELRISKNGGVYSAYCIEFGVGARTGDSFTSQGDFDWLSASQKKLINICLMFGFNIAKTGHVTTSGELDEYVGTQLLIWQISSGFLNTDQEDRICEVVYLNNPGARGYYNEIRNKVLKYRSVPSFGSERQSTAPTYELAYNSSNGKYEAALTDTNNVIGTMDISIPGADISINGNQLNVSVPSGNNVVNLSATAEKEYVSADMQACSVDFWISSEGKQSFVTPELGGRPDPVKVYFNFKISTGNLRILKDSEDGAKEGFKFRVQGNGVDQVLTSSADGSAGLDNIPAGSYQVSEIEADKKYNIPPTQTIVVNSNQTTTANFYNSIKKGRVKLLKGCSYHKDKGEYLSGAVYRIYKEDGTDTGMVLTTDADQWVYSDYLLYGNYYLQEEKPPEEFDKDPTTKHGFGINADGQVRQVTAYNTPLSDVYPEFIPPNAVFRAGTEIVASWYIHTDGHVAYGDVPLRVRLDIYYITNDRQRITLPSQHSEVVCPSNNKNLVSFKVQIPVDAKQIYFTCEALTPNYVIETNTINDFSRVNKTVRPADSKTPDTEFESRPTDYTKPNEDTQVSTDDFCSSPVSSATWEQWEYDSGAFTKQKYGAKFDVQHTAEPDADSPSRSKNGDIWTMRSGYGITLESRSQLMEYPGLKMPDASVYTQAQNENAYFPEFGYSAAYGKYRNLQLTDKSSTSILEFYPNAASLSNQGAASNKRVHYVPLWFPDGAYTLKTYTYDAWCPAGMLSSSATIKSLTIEQSMYDDWYVGK